MGFLSRPNQETELPDRLINSPFLRVVLFDLWFRTAFICFVLLVIFLALFIPKIWRVTPRGFLPVVKISGLDMAQAWSLKRSALRAMAAGDFERATYAWQAAVANNPADAELARGTLRNFLQADLPSAKYQRAAVGQSIWLLRLTGTNAVDVELVSRVYDKFELYDLTLRLLAPSTQHLTPSEEAVYLKALFHSGEMTRFADRWQKLTETSTAIPRDLKLYHAAYLAGWGSSSDAREEGRTQLDAALESPGTRIVSNRLRLMVCVHLGDADGYAAALQRLSQWQADRLPEHLTYWHLLTTLGRGAEAVRLARSFPRPPATAGEARKLAEIYLVLGLRDEARQFLRDQVQPFRYSAEIWALQANLLIEDRKWDELRELALQIRQHPAVRDTLLGYSYYLEGRAELGQQRVALAQTAFAKVAQRPFEDRALALGIASSLLSLGYPAVARDLLVPLESDLAGNPEYWQTLFAAAYELKQPDLMITAAARTYAIEPGNVTAANNYAAALLVSRQHSEEAIKLTLQLVGRFPNSTTAKINHGLALLLNRRNREAKALFQSIAPEKLNGIETTSLYLGLFELYISEQQFDQARLAIDRIDRKYLFPNQIKWLDETRRQLPERQAAK